MGTAADSSVQLKQAGRLAQQGQYAQAMNIYRQIYGGNPPPGDTAMAYYETEAATEDGRPHAIQGLRELVAKFPSDSQYQVALGRILTYNPKTRPEGRRLLEAHPNDPLAVEGLRQSLLWDAQNPASAGAIRQYLEKHPDQQLSTVLNNEPRRGGGRPMTAEQRAAAAVYATRSAEDREAYRELNAKHLDAAETKFKAILANHPDDANALAGLGYIRMQQANFGGAISFLVQAKQDGSKDPNLDSALVTSRFWYTMGEAAMALNEDNLPAAEKGYRTALAMRPDSVEALEGLGGTLLKAQQPEAAVPVFVQYVRLKPAAARAWRGLFLAESGAGHAAEALDTERHAPAGVRAELSHDPLYLRAMASALSSVGRDADAQRVLKAALDLPFPADTKGMQADTELQYAALLEQANHLDQAAGLYKRVLARDPNNLGAWRGLVRAQHAAGNDPLAAQTLDSMPQTIYARAMRDNGFDVTVASIYETQNRLDVSQDILEKSLQQQQTGGGKASVSVETQLAGIYLKRGNSQAAYGLYQQILAQNANSTVAWKGMLTALHGTGRDQEALAEIQQMPAPVRATLENDPDYLQAVAGIYNGLGRPREAQIFLRRVQEHYLAQHTAPPADVDIQTAWLLYNTGNDAGLYRQLMALGGRPDLTDTQRRTVQTIWANWAVRRANQASAKGNDRLALNILNATAQSFPDNPGVIKALANGYARAGMAKQAVAIWRSMDLRQATASDYEGAVGAALADNDLKDAETWLRFALNQYPHNAEILILGAKFEQARGDTNRAADYYRASLAAMPAPDPGAELATELSRPSPVAPLPGLQPGQDLSSLLAPSADGQGNQGALDPSQMQQQATQPGQPYLPGGPSYTPVPVPSGGYDPNGATNAVPSYMGAPGTGLPSMPATGPSQPANTNAQPRLRDFVPQAAAGELLPAEATHVPVIQVANEAPAEEAAPADVVLSVAAYRQIQIARLTQQIVDEGEVSMLHVPAPELSQGATLRAASYLVRPYEQQSTPQQNGTQAGQQPGSAPAPQIPQPNAADVYGPFVPYSPPKPQPVQLGASPATREIQQPEVTDVLPTAKYAPGSRTKPHVSSQAELNAQRAAAARRHRAEQNAAQPAQYGRQPAAAPASTPAIGYSKPPAEDYSTPPTQPAQYTGQQAAPAQRSPAVQAAPVYVQQPQGSSSMPAVQTGGSGAQQYPQPYTNSYPVVRRRGRTQRAAAPVVSSSPSSSPGPTPSYPALNYPGVGQTLGYQPYPSIGPAYPLPPAPTDSDLMDRSLPPLRGGYDQTPKVPLTERQQTELALQQLEASYSGWLGGTASARYRSGVPGYDRLTDLETSFEASFVADNNVRFTVVPTAVFLNSGTLNQGNYQGVAGSPILGTFNSASTTAAQPNQQSANGIGGEFQITGQKFGLALGYTPYQFLVENVTGRALFRPNEHFTFYVDRDAVKETELSYAGLRDPGSVSAVYPGNIWGGVVSTGGGVRFDTGTEKAGFYITADGADLTGYHVLQNDKFEGSAGAYFLAHTFPGYGRLNVGASAFGMHFAQNERPLSYGLGGYFSPSAYFLASVPITFVGRYNDYFHYSIAGSVGVQTFQEATQLYFPLDRGAEDGFRNLGNCTQAQLSTGTCGIYGPNSSTGGNYSINAEGAYRITDHWYGGGFLSANNTNNYNTVTAGFFVRYLFRSQVGTDDYPTGLFPVEGFRPLRVP